VEAVFAGAIAITSPGPVLSPITSQSWWAECRRRGGRVIPEVGSIRVIVRVQVSHAGGNIGVDALTT
jgi:hypothetical protein